MSWFPNQFPHFLFSVSWLWTWFNLVAIFVLLRGNMLVLFISNTCFLCTPSFMSGLLRDIYALSRSSYHLHFASHFRTCFLFTTTLLEFHLHFTALSLYLISLGYPNCYVLPLGCEVFSTSLRPAQLCSMTSGPSTNLFSVICLRSEPCSYKKCLVSERYAFTPPRDKVSLIRLQGNSEVSWKDCLLPFNWLLYCMHCSSLPWEWGTAPCSWRRGQLWRVSTDFNSLSWSLFIGLPGDSQSYI